MQMNQICLLLLLVISICVLAVRSVDIDILIGSCSAAQHAYDTATSENLGLDLSSCTNQFECSSSVVAVVDPCNELQVDPSQRLNVTYVFLTYQQAISNNSVALFNAPMLHFKAISAIIQDVGWPSVSFLTDASEYSRSLFQTALPYFQHATVFDAMMVANTELELDILMSQWRSYQSQIMILLLSPHNFVPYLNILYERGYINSRVLVFSPGYVDYHEGIQDITLLNPSFMDVWKTSSFSIQRLLTTSSGLSLQSSGLDSLVLDAMRAILRGLTNIFNTWVPFDVTSARDLAAELNRGDQCSVFNCYATLPNSPSPSALSLVYDVGASSLTLLQRAQLNRHGTSSQQGQEDSFRIAWLDFSGLRSSTPQLKQSSALVPLLPPATSKLKINMALLHSRLDSIASTSIAATESVFLSALDYYSKEFTDVDIDYVIKDTTNACEAAAAGLSDDIDVVIGAAYSNCTRVIAEALKPRGIPQLSHIAGAAMTNIEFPNFFSIVHTDAVGVGALVSTIQHLGITCFGTFATTFSPGIAYQSLLSQSLEAVGVTLSHHVQLSEPATASNLKTSFTELINEGKSRVNFIFSSHFDVSAILSVLQELNLLSDDYRWIFTQLSSISEIQQYLAVANRPDPQILFLANTIFDETAWRDINDRYPTTDTSTSPYPYMPQNMWDAVHAIFIAAQSQYDATINYQSTSLARDVIQAGLSSIDRASAFQGVSKPLIWFENNRGPHSGTLYAVTKSSVESVATIFDTTTNVDEQFTWRNVGDLDMCNAPAIAVPSSGDSSSTTIILAILVPLALIAIIIVLILMLAIRKQKARKKANLLPNEDVFTTRTSLGTPREIRYRDLELLQKLGTGSFADVSRALLQEQGRPQYDVAVKHLRKDAEDDDKLMLLREAYIMAQITPHDNVVQLIGAVNDSNSPTCVVLQLCDLGSLEKFLSVRFGRDHLLSWPKRIKMLQQIAAGMHHVTARCGVVHRDLACRNVLLTPDEKCKVADFGLGMLMKRRPVQPEIDSSVPNTTLDMLLSKDTENILQRVPIRWTAPEGFFDVPQYSEYSDVWSFGVVMFEVCVHCSEVPYANDNNSTVMQRVRAGDLLDQPLACPNVLYDMMTKCWQPNAFDRPNFEQIQQDLSSISAAIQTLIEQDNEMAYTWSNPSRGRAPQFPSNFVLPTNTKPQPTTATDSVVDGKNKKKSKLLTRSRDHEVRFDSSSSESSDVKLVVPGTSGSRSNSRETSVDRSLASRPWNPHVGKYMRKTKDESWKPSSDGTREISVSRSNPEHPQYRGVMSKIASVALQHQIEPSTSSDQSQPDESLPSHVPPRTSPLHQTRTRSPSPMTPSQIPLPSKPIPDENIELEDLPSSTNQQELTEDKNLTQRTADVNVDANQHLKALAATSQILLPTSILSQIGSTVGMSDKPSAFGNLPNSQSELPTIPVTPFQKAEIITQPNSHGEEFQGLSLPVDMNSIRQAMFRLNDDTNA